jgi:hypothetical protein
MSGAKLEKEASSGGKFIEELLENPLQVNNTSLLDIKIALDDVLVKYLQEVLGYKQNHRLTDKNLWMQFILNLLAGMTALYAYYVPFAQARTVLGLTCLAFFALNTFWGVYYYILADHYTFVGTLEKQGGISNQWLYIETDLKPPSTSYRISIVIGDKELKSGSELDKRIVSEHPVEEWFDVTGTLEPVTFAKDIYSIIQSAGTEKKQK